MARMFLSKFGLFVVKIRDIDISKIVFTWFNPFSCEQHIKCVYSQEVLNEEIKLPTHTRKKVKIIGDKVKRT